MCRGGKWVAGGLLSGVLASSAQKILGLLTYRSIFRNCMAVPARDFLTLLIPSRRLMGMREEPGILDGLCLQFLRKSSD